MKKEFVFETANEQHVRAMFVYANSGKLFYDKEHTQQVTASDAKRFFITGDLILDDDGTLMKPVSVSDTEATFGEDAVYELAE